MTFSICCLLSCTWIARRFDQPASKLPGAQNRGILRIKTNICYLGGTGIAHSASQRKILTLGGSWEGASFV